MQMVIAELPEHCKCIGASVHSAAGYAITYYLQKRPYKTLGGSTPPSECARHDAVEVVGS
jgi:hypothetical protein